MSDEASQQQEKTSELTGKQRRAHEHIREQYRCDALDNHITEVIFANPQISKRDLAAICGCTSTTLRKRLKKPAVTKRLDEMRSTAVDLLKRGQVMGVRRLMQLMMSKDEYIALAASKIILQPLINVQTLNMDSTQRLVYEVQIGPQGQVYQTMREGTDPANKQNFPNTMDLVLEGNLVDG